MDDDIREIVEETKKLVEEDHKILKSMQRRANFSLVIKFFYWIVIIGVAIGTYIYVQPYVDQAQSMYQNIKKTNEKISTGFPSSVEEFKKFFEGMGSKDK